MIHQSRIQTDKTLPHTTARPLLALIEQVKRFEPRYHHGDQDWRFFIKIGSVWNSLFVKFYQDTWYINLQRDKEFDRAQCLQFNQKTTKIQGLEEFDPSLFRVVSSELNKIHTEVKKDPLKYHGELLASLSPTMREGVIPRRLVRELLPEWQRFDLEFSEEERKRIISILEKGVSVSLPSMTAAQYFEYVKVAYLANPSTFERYETVCPPDASGRDLYCRFADGRDGGLRDIDLNSEEAFARWYDSKAWSGGHPFEIFRGGNSTHIDLSISRIQRGSEQGWNISLSAYSSSRLVEACRAALAFSERGMPCEVNDRNSYLLRLRCEDNIGIVPEGGGIEYAWHHFPKEFHVADCIKFNWFRDESTRRQIRPWREIKKVVTWMPLSPLQCAVETRE